LPPHVIDTLFGIPSQVQCGNAMKKALPPKPEPKTITVTIKVRASTNKALMAAAKGNDRSKSELVGELTELWLREHGYLK
jgi:hypothetical protein